MVDINYKTIADVQTETAGLACETIENLSLSGQGGVPSSSKNPCVALVPFAGSATIDIELLHLAESDSLRFKGDIDALPSRPLPEMRPAVRIVSSRVLPPSLVLPGTCRKWLW